MTGKEIDNIKKSINELKLDENYYNDLRYNCMELWKKRRNEYDYVYYKDGAQIDIYNPDGYNENLYLVTYKDKVYLGNEQIPIDIDNKERTVNMIEYWFRGNCCEYTVLHEFIGIHNKSINYRGCGCNQGLLNIIKAKIIELIKTNLNVNDIGEIDSDEMKNQYGKIISKYKAKTKKKLKKTTIGDFANTILIILNDIERNIQPWMKMLYEKNRYWIISENEQDINESRQFFTTYGYSPECVNDELYKAILIIFKEYLLWQTCENYTGNYYKTIFSKKAYIMHPKCTTNRLYDWKKIWDNYNPIDLILSICFKSVYSWKRTKDKADFRNFKNKLYKNINI